MLKCGPGDVDGEERTCGNQVRVAGPACWARQD